METDWKQVILYPLAIALVAGIIPVLVEYFAIIPWLRRRETHVEKISGAGDEKNKTRWSDGIRNAIIHFKKLPNPYIWGGPSLKYNFVSISQMAIGRGQAELNRGLAELSIIITERYILDFFSRPKEVAKHKLIINRAGDIYDFELIGQKNKLSDVRILPFPLSWVVIVVILFAIVYSQLPKKPVIPQVNGTPVPNFWTIASPIVADTFPPLPGTIGAGQVDAYTFSSNLGKVMTVKVISINNFYLYLQIFDTKDALVDRINVGYTTKEGSLSFAPELNANYLIVVAPVDADLGGSYTISITSNDTQ